MADRLATGLAHLTRRLQERAGRQVTYRRGADSVTLTATVGSSLLRLTEPGGGSRIERTERDYLIAPDLLVLGGRVVEPRRGDRVEDAADGRVYEVLAPEGEAPWRYADGRGTLLRVHCKDVGAL